jgi:hypothetical protein
MAADDLRCDRGLHVGQVEDILLGSELGVQDDLEPQVTELASQLRGRAGLERVVHLVRLLEQVVAQRLVGLLTIPGTAVGGPETVADRRHRPRPGHGCLGLERGEVERRGEVIGVELADGGRRMRPEPADRMVCGIGTREDLQRLTAAWTVPPGQGRHVGRFASIRPCGSSSEQHGQRHDQRRSRRLERRPDQPFARDDLQAGGGIQPEPEARLRDEGVQHPAT